MGRTIRFTNNADTFTQGESANNIEVRLYMLAGNDQVRLDRDDEFGGGNWADMGTGNDRLLAIEGGNVFFLGAGNDVYFGAVNEIAFDRPSDRVIGGAGDDLFAVMTFKGHYLGGLGADRFVTMGHSNTFNGGEGRDSLTYGLIDDHGSIRLLVDLAAGYTVVHIGTDTARETLISIENVAGGHNDDRVFGSAVSNRLAGGGGIDQLTGRGGADTFVWRTADEAPTDEGGLERVTDFRSAQGDRIDIRKVDANQNSFDGDQAFTFIGYRGFTERVGQLSAIRRGDDTVLRGDTDGDGIADFAIRLVGVSSLTRDDLVL